MTTPIVAVGYLRCSTDNRDQDVERGLEVLRPWCAREGVTLVDFVLDEGSSASKLSPFERPRFVDACVKAKALGATAIVVECADRFSRQGGKLDAWAEVELDRRYGLALLRADKALAEHGSMVAAVGDTIHAEGAKAWVAGHSKKVRSGMAKAAREGATFGRPRKDIAPAELSLAIELRAQGLGWRRVAHEVSKRRGAFDLTDPASQRRVAVSRTLLRRVIESGTKGEAARKA